MRLQSWFRAGLALLAVVAVGGLSGAAAARVVQAPLGGGWLTLPEQRVLCEVATNGWGIDAAHRRVRPPSTVEALGRAVTLNSAKSAAECAAGNTQELTLLATGPLPQIDPQSVVLYVDAGRLEFVGKGLLGMRVDWKSAKVSGHDVCVEVEGDRGRQGCSLAVGRDLPADPSLVRLGWAPPDGRLGADVFTYDARGNLLGPEETEIAITRVIISRVFGRSRMLDLSTGEGRVQLARPEAVGGVECTGAQCDMRSESVRVHTVPLAVSQVGVRLRLLPRVSLLQGSALSQTSQETFDLVRCPMTISSGPVVRNADDAQLLARLSPECELDPESLTWTLDGKSVSLVKTEITADGTFVLLRVGRINDDRLTLVAARASDRSALAVSPVTTWELPLAHTTLLLPGFGEIDFVPKNREAIVLVSPLTRGRLKPLPVVGAYSVSDAGAESRIVGRAGASGYTALRLGYRPDAVPAAFATTDFATLIDPVQRPLREANIPVPLGASNLSREPIVELLCGVGAGKIERIAPGVTRHIPFSERHSCRLLIHRERIPDDNGEQLLEINVSIADVSGAERADGRSSQRLLLRHDDEPEVLWIRGARHQFDRIKVEVGHVPDESLYVISRRRYSPAPSGQWVVVTEDASVKFYATATIPASLYRFSRDPQDLGSGPLSLNFGVLSRFALLDDEGHESLLGLETGVMGMGLATDGERQLAVVSGLGVSVPLGNPNQPTQAAINIHAWMAYSLGTRNAQTTDTQGRVTGTIELSPWAFVFGPSITVGNVAAFL